MMQDSLCGTKGLIDPKAEVFEVDDAALLRSPDSTWMDLMDELIEPDDHQPMLCSPVPSSDHSFEHSFEDIEPKVPPTRMDSSSEDLASIVGRAATPPLPPAAAAFAPPKFEHGSSSSSPAPTPEEHFGAYSIELEPFLAEPLFSAGESSLHKVPSAPHLESLHLTSPATNIPARNFHKTKSFCLSSTGGATARSMPNHHSSPLHQLSPPGRTISNSSKKQVSSPSPPSLTSPLQNLLDQDPSTLLLLHTPTVQVGGLQLIHMLLSCGEKIDQEDYSHARNILRQLQHHVSPTGNSIHRVATYFTDALAARLNGSGYHSFNALRAYDRGSLEEILGAYHILYQVCPYIKFAHFTANQAIFEAFEGEQQVHIIDLEILQGYQWPAFMQALAARQREPPHLRITGVGMPLEAVQETGKRLADLAGTLHLPFEYHAVGERLEDLKSHMLHRRAGEALAVNSIDRLHRLFCDDHLGVSPLVRLLGMIREQAPMIITIVEQEASHNTNSFLKRFLEAMHYYSAIFDSLEATLPQASPERAKVEQVVFSSEIMNIVACEGSQRIVRHEKVDKWCKIMESIGFYNVALSPSAVHQSRLLLRLYQTNGYTLVEDKGCLLLGWQDRAIIGASAWRC